MEKDSRRGDDHDVVPEGSRTLSSGRTSRLRRQLARSATGASCASDEEEESFDLSSAASTHVESSIFGENTASDSEMDPFRSPHHFTSRLYVDSFTASSHVPQVPRDAEIMLFVDLRDHDLHSGERDLDLKDRDLDPWDYNSGGKVKNRTRVNSSLSSVTSFASIDVVVDQTKGRQRLRPVTFSSGERLATSHTSHSSHKHKTMIDVTPRLSDIVAPQSRDCHALDVSRYDTTDHQILFNLLSQSIYISQQTLASMIHPVDWTRRFGHQQPIAKQYLLEEVRLTQHSIQKYKLEVKALNLRSLNLHSHHTLIADDYAEDLDSIQSLRTSIQREIEELDAGMSCRMRSVTGVVTDKEISVISDLASLGVIQKMIELLYEQEYHNNLVSSMTSILMSEPKPHKTHDTKPHMTRDAKSCPTLDQNSLRHPTSRSSDHSYDEHHSGEHHTGAGGSTSSMSTDSLVSALLHRISSLERRCDEQSASSLALSASIRESQTAMVEEIRRIASSIKSS